MAQTLYNFKVQDGTLRNANIDDYFENPDGSWDIVTTRFPKEIFNELNLLHAYLEHILTKHSGISELEISAFDAAFEERILRGEVPEDAEPGDAKDSPYREQHQFTEYIEKRICRFLNINWQDYVEAGRDLWRKKA